MSSKDRGVHAHRPINFRTSAPGTLTPLIVHDNTYLGSSRNSAALSTTSIVDWLVENDDPVLPGKTSPSARSSAALSTTSIVDWLVENDDPVPPERTSSSSRSSAALSTTSIVDWSVEDDDLVPPGKWSPSTFSSASPSSPRSPALPRSARSVLGPHIVNPQGDLYPSDGVEFSETTPGAFEFFLSQARAKIVDTVESCEITGRPDWSSESAFDFDPQNSRRSSMPHAPDHSSATSSHQITAAINSPLSGRTASVAPFGKATWRDIILRGIEDSFQDCLPTCRASCWLELREKMQIYPFSVHYAIQALQYIASSTLQSAFLTKTINGMDHHGLLVKIQEWISWSPLQSFARHNLIRETLMEVLRHLEMIAGIENESDIFGFPAWCGVIRHAVDYDIDDMEREIVLLIDSERNLAQSVAELSSEEINTLMDVLQSYIDRQATSHRLFERFLQKLVKASGSLPRYLFLPNVARIGSHPVSGGGFADVWKGTFGGRTVALKVLRIFGHPSERDRINQDFCKESMIWRQFNHRHVHQFWGVSIDEFSPQLAMVSPWMENGDILTYLKECPNANRKSMVFAIALGLRYLHALKPKVIHGDLRATNVLIDDEGQPRLADFGLAKVVDSQANSVAASSFNGKGSMRWQAPELLTSSLFPGASLEISTSSDVYAFAAVCLEIFTEDVPFSYLRDGEVVLEVAVKKQTPRRPGYVALERGLDNRLWELMVDCWSTNPCDRPTMEAVVHKLSIIEETPATRSERDGLQSENYVMEKVDVLTLPGLMAAVRYSRRRNTLQ